ncbi:MAG: hypothetical protein IJF69_02305 [Clostridia bacterium]|nr:hypothetical protein [Clostridia bacterium]
MGSWFSNFSIRKKDNISNDTITKHLIELMERLRYIPVETIDEADGALTFFSTDYSQWYTVCSDLLPIDDPSSFSHIAKTVSEQLHSDVMTISCFDSDYMFINLVDADNGIDAWAGIGSARGMGIRRRTNITAWKTKVKNYPLFFEIIKEKYVFAEDALIKLEDCLSLPYLQSSSAFEYLHENDLACNAKHLYFKLPSLNEEPELPKLVKRTYPASPLTIGKPEFISLLSKGGKSKGLSVFFTGSYVENDEITFSELRFVKSNGDHYELPFEFKKVQLNDGQWAYHYNYPGFIIPQKANDSLPPAKKYREEDKNEITIRFIPQGNPDKVDEIAIYFVPNKNVSGQTAWIAKLLKRDPRTRNT